MSVRDHFRFPALVKLAALATVLAVVGILLIHIVFRRDRPPGIVPVEEPGLGGQAGLKEDVRHLEYRDGRVWLEAQGERAVLGDDGTTRLEGNVRIVDRRAERGSEMVITSGSVSFDKNLTLFVFGGGVRISEGDAVLESPSFEYDKGRGLVRTDRGALYSSPGLAGTSQVFLYDLEKDILLLSSGFRLEIPGGGEDSSGSVITGGRLRYERALCRGEAWGTVTAGSEGFRASSEALQFELAGDEGALRTATMSEGARIALSARGSGETEAAPQTVGAGSIRLELWPGTSVVSELAARGDPVLSAALSEGKDGVVRGGSVRAVFDQEGVLREFEAAEGAAAEVEDEKEGKRTIGGQIVRYDQSSGVVVARGRDAEPARLDSRRFNLEAQSVSIHVATDEIRAGDGAKGVFVPGPEERGAGFFEAGQPVFFACREFKRLPASKRLDFEGDVRLWQGKQFLEAAALGTEEDRGTMTAGGGVRAVLIHRTEGNPDERIEIGGERMTSDPGQRLILLEGRCGLAAGEVHLSAESIGLIFRPDRRGLDRLEARTGAVVRWRAVEGRGDRADFDFGGETIVLVGRPVLRETDKVSARGDKLTFRLADDRILIENEGQERSVAVIKS